MRSDYLLIEALPVLLFIFPRSIFHSLSSIFLDFPKWMQIVWICDKKKSLSPESVVDERRQSHSRSANNLTREKEVVPMYVTGEEDREHITFLFWHCQRRFTIENPIFVLNEIVVLNIAVDMRSKEIIFEILQTTCMSSELRRPDLFASSCFLHIYGSTEEFRCNRFGSIHRSTIAENCRIPFGFYCRS